MYDDWAGEQGLSSNSALILYSLYEATATTFRWTDHDLVEYCISENYLSRTGVIADKIK